MGMKLFIAFLVVFLIIVFLPNSKKQQKAGQAQSYLVRDSSAEFFSNFTKDWKKDEKGWLKPGEPFDEKKYLNSTKNDKLIPKIEKDHGDRIRAACMAARLINVNVIFGIIAAESSNNPDAGKGTSEEGKGLMRITPEAAQDIGMDFKYVFDPDSNVAMGVRYFSKMLDRTGGKVLDALIAYRYGWGGYQEIIKNHKPEEVVYALRVMAVAKKASAMLAKK